MTGVPGDLAPGGSLAARSSSVKEVMAMLLLITRLIKLILRRWWR